jgi:sulfite reductase (NADPH) flavoprotein alpha-component
MFRLFHSVLGLVLGLALMFVAATGVILSVAPTIERLATPAIVRGTSVADLAAAVVARHDNVSTIRVRVGDVVTAAFTDGEVDGIERIDPATGAGLGAYRPSSFVRTVTGLHRAFGLGSNGRIAAALTAFAMLGVTLSGFVLLARRLGGVRALLRPVRGRLCDRLHGEIGRAAAIGLLVSSLTGLWMSASTFGLVPEPATALPAVTASAGRPAAIADLAALRAVDVADLRELSLADPAVPGAVFDLTTAAGEALIDPVNGTVLAASPASGLARIDALVRLLHTGRGAPVVALLLGLASATVPLLTVTGFLAWLRRRRAMPRAVVGVAPAAADTVILVGSEWGSTRGFAATLATALGGAGHRVHTTDMNRFSAAHLGAERLLILAATRGAGEAPASAEAFLGRLDRLEATARPPVAVLGFGDRTFADFCGHAVRVGRALDAKGFPRLLEPKRIDRRSAQEFRQWGHDLGRVLGHDLDLVHVAERPATETLELVGREDYGAAVGAPVAILRFAAPLDRRSGRRRPLPVFEAGDLLGILPAGEEMARFYSLASSSPDGVVEICVRLRSGGICSTMLHRLTPGDRIDAFVRTNPGFRPAAAASSLILIGAGVGIGPLTGFARANDPARPAHLYWGGRSAASDFLYEHELARLLAERRLASLTTAFSRDSSAGGHVEERLFADGRRLRALIGHGAQILVCGSRDLGRDVARTIEPIVRPLGLDLATLRAGGRYVEDVF